MGNTLAGVGADRSAMLGATDTRAIASIEFVRAEQAIREIESAKAKYTKECERRKRLLQKFQDLALTETQELSGTLLDAREVFTVSPEVERYLRAPTVGMANVQAMGVAA